MPTRILNITFQVVIFGVLVGVVVAIFSLGFVEGVGFISGYRTSFSSCVFQINKTCFSFMPLLFLISCAGLIVLVKRYMKIDRYHGPADVILAAHSSSADLETKTGLLSTFSAFVSASGGASVGQYGPLVHLGGTLGNYINKKTPGLLSKDVFIGCGVAAAISAGFNSPIGGIIFAHEAILRHFSFKAIAPIAVSSVASATLTNVFFPSGILFQNTSSEIALFPAVSLSLILGPLCALCAVVFMKFLLHMQKNANLIAKDEIRRIIFAAVICGIIGGFFPEVLGLGGKTIEGILSEQFTALFLILILVLKLFVSVICLSLGFFGGVFSPALVLGASVGGVVTYIGYLFGMELLGDSLILAGMAALSASVIGAPIASIVIIFELTHSYDLAFVSIICVAGSCLVSGQIFGHSFFDKQLLNRNFQISRGRSEILLSEIKVANLLAKSHYLKINKETSRQDALKCFEKSDFTEAYIVNTENTLIGKIKVNELLKDGKFIRENIDNILTLNANETVSEAIKKASDFVGESIPVIDSSKNLLGVITEADLFTQYLKTQDNISKIEKDDT